MQFKISLLFFGKKAPQHNEQTNALARLKVYNPSRTSLDLVFVLDVFPQLPLVVRLPHVVDAPVDGALEDERAHDDAEGEGRRAFRHASVESARQRHGFAQEVLQAVDVIRSLCKAKFI